MFTETTRMAAVPDGEVFMRLCVPADALAAQRTPLVVVNGGPGGSHELMRHYLLPLAAERRICFYDQLGSHYSPAPLDDGLIRMARFAPELEAVLDGAGYGRAIVLGHSFGACVALDAALSFPDRLAGMILSCPLISTPRWIEDACRLLAQLPQAAQDAIRLHEAAGTTDDPAYKEAEALFYNRHVCRIDPWPAPVLAAFSLGNREIYRAMWGSSEFVCTGTLRDYDRFPDLPRLTMPVQLICGRHDEATPETLAEAARLIPDCRLDVVEEASHLAFVERTDAYLDILRRFFATLEA